MVQSACHYVLAFRFNRIWKIEGYVNMAILDILAILAILSILATKSVSFGLEIGAKIHEIIRLELKS